MARAAKTDNDTASTDKERAARDRALDLAIQSIAKDYGENSIMRLGDDGAHLKVDVIQIGRAHVG